MEKLKSRKFWVAIVYVMAYLAAQFAGVDLDAEEVVGLVVPLIGYLLGQSWVDSKQQS